MLTCPMKRAGLLGQSMLVLLLMLVGASLRAADPTIARPDHVRVAAVQITGYDKGDLPRPGYDPANDLAAYVDRAGQDQAQLIVFPEYVLGRIRVPSQATETLAAAARRNSIYVIVGCWELLQEDQYANTALLFGREGEIIGKYRKTHAAVDHFDEQATAWTQPPADKSLDWFIQNDPEWTMERGQTLPTFELDFGTIGIMTCYDGWFPEPPRVLSLAGAEVIVWINGRRGNVEDFIVKSIMFQSHVAMITTNQAYGGGTMIGDWSQGPVALGATSPPRQEAYLTADINLQRVRQARSTSRNFAQRRPDLYAPLADR